MSRKESYGSAARLQWLEWLRAGGAIPENDDAVELITHMLRDGCILSEDTRLMYRYLGEALLFVGNNWERNEDMTPKLQDDMQHMRNLLRKAFCWRRSSVLVGDRFEGVERLQDSIADIRRKWENDFGAQMLDVLIASMIRKHENNVHPSSRFNRDLVLFLNEQGMLLSDSELCGHIPQLLVLGMPLFWEPWVRQHTSQTRVSISIVWFTEELSPLRRRCWSLMLEAMRRRWCLSSSLSGELARQHVFLYEDVMQRFLTCLKIETKWTFLENQCYASPAVDESYESVWTKNEEEELPFCARLCELTCLICPREERYRLIPMSQLVKQLAYPYKTPQPGSIWCGLQTFAFEIAPLFINVDSLCPPLSILRRRAAKCLFALACVKHKAIDLHALPLLLEELNKTDFVCVNEKMKSLAADCDVATIFNKVHHQLAKLYLSRIPAEVADGIPQSEPEYPMVQQLMFSESDQQCMPLAVLHLASQLREDLFTVKEYVRASKHNSEAQLGPLLVLDAQSELMQRVRLACSPAAWHSRAYMAMHAWTENTALLSVCPFKYYQRHWLRHAHLMAGLPFNGRRQHSESYVTELSTDPRHLFTVLCKAVIRRSVIEQVDPNFDGEDSRKWLDYLVKRLSRRRRTLRTQHRVAAAMKQCGIRVRSAVSLISSVLDDLTAKAAVCQRLAVALDENDKPWRCCDVEHAVRCGVPSSTITQ
ncbi:MAG: hypothetical protein MHM6MM_008518, partial [Cercozoa sp. M6MM]